MESISALKSVIHIAHDENKHPHNQGYVTPMLMGIVAYALSLSFAFGCMAIYSVLL